MKFERILDIGNISRLNDLEISLMIVNAVIMYLSYFSFLTANTILHALINILKNFSKMESRKCYAYLPQKEILN